MTYRVRGWGCKHESRWMIRKMTLLRVHREKTRGEKQIHTEEEQKRGQILPTVRRKEAAQKCNRTRSESLRLFILVNTTPRILLKS